MTASHLCTRPAGSSVESSVFGYKTINLAARNLRNYSVSAQRFVSPKSRICEEEPKRRLRTARQSRAQLILSCVHLWTDTRSHYADMKPSSVFLCVQSRTTPGLGSTAPVLRCRPEEGVCSCDPARNGVLDI